MALLQPLTYRTPTHKTINALKPILKFILYTGAVVCCLAGLWVIYVAIANFRETKYPVWLNVLVIEALFVCLAFTPAFMLLTDYKTKTWHRIFIGIVEAIVIALVLLALFIYISMRSTTG